MQPDFGIKRYSFKGKHIVLLLSLCLAIAILAVYGGLVDHPFHMFDDPIYVTNNYFVQNGLTWEGVSWAFESLDVANWHPLTWLSHMADIELFGPKPAGHYFSNIVFHWIGCVLLFWWLRILFNSIWRAFLVTLIWAIHPANVECVAWIAQRKTLLASIFLFWGFAMYVRYTFSRSRTAYLVCVVCQLLASMCKPVAVLYPLALVLMDVILVEGNRSDETISGGFRSLVTQCFRKLPEKIPFVVIAVLLSVLTYYAQDATGATNYTHSLLWRLGNVCTSYYEYWLKSMSEPDSSILYVLFPLVWWKVCAGIGLIIVASIIIVVCAKRARVVVFGVSWFFGMMLPTIGIIQVGSQRMADRYLGLSLIGFLVLVVFSLNSILEKYNKRMVYALLCLAWAGGLACQAGALCADWSDRLGLCLNAMKYGGISSTMLTNSSCCAVENRDIKLARKYLLRIIDQDKASYNWAVMDFLEKKYEDAIIRSKSLLHTKEYRLMAAFIIAQSCVQLEKYEDARRAFLGAMKCMPPRKSYMLMTEKLRLMIPLMIENLSKRESKTGLEASAVKQEVESREKVLKLQ